MDSMFSEAIYPSRVPTKGLQAAAKAALSPLANPVLLILIFLPRGHAWWWSLLDL
jgi:hypothetical protein